MTKTTWTNAIYDIYDFLYWEPQHIWKIKNKNSNIKSVSIASKHIKQMEVSLNQILNIFFYLLPKENFLEFINFITKKSIYRDNYEFWIWNIVEWINDSTQPDFFFVWDNFNIAIEMKTKSKSSLEQIMKYAFFHLKENEIVWHKKKFLLIFLWEWEFKNLWNDKYDNAGILKENFQKYEIQDTTKKWNLDLVAYKKEIYNLIEKSEIAFLNYSMLKEFCILKINENIDNHIFVNLLNWIIREIDDRRIVK